MTEEVVEVPFGAKIVLCNHDSLQARFNVVFARL